MPDTATEACIQIKRWFSDSALTWGYQCFMPQSELNDPAKGFLLNGRLIVEVEFSLMGMFRNFI
ncbi:hypothetical protein OSB04_016008 [Centaurea solstitialis]|uniref:MATH domain-containing protein n=1 Tax=Centaurea solstitialis TaxID=347529 RepID=A0AA38TK39_9ASTR|nr:hypothetical protein OSB04_016008 [Centaurea solstitialis]